MSVPNARDEVKVDAKLSETFGLAKPQDPAKAAHEIVVLTHAQRFTPKISSSTPGASKYKVGVARHPLVVVCSCQWECHADSPEQAEQIGQAHLERYGQAI